MSLASSPSETRRDEPPANRRSRYPFARLPRIDYAAHPAYRAGERRSAALRLRALRTFARGLGVALLRWGTGYENLPKPPQGSNRLRWFAAHIPHYGGAIARDWIARLSRPAPATGPVAARPLLELKTDGVTGGTFGPKDRSKLRQRLEPHFRALAQHLRMTPAEKQRFDDNRLWIDPKADDDLYRWFAGLLERAGLIEAASGHFGRPLRVAHLIAQINVPENDFWRGQFADAGIADPACNYCHVDTAHNVAKAIVYVDEVAEDNGPFSYVAGSHRTADGFWPRAVRRANDYAGLSSTRPAARLLFSALPAFLRHKCAFGPDLQDSHPYANAILECERVFTTGEAHCILFDPNGIHRGGMVRRGTRRVVTVLFSPAS